MVTSPDDSTGDSFGATPSAPTGDLARLENATGTLDPPFAVVDLDAFWHNARDLVRRASGKPIRLASKSVRCRDLQERVLRTPGWRGTLAFTLPEALWLASCGFDDLVVAYPTTHRSALRELAQRDDDRVTMLMLGWTTGMLAQYTRYRRSADSQQRRQTKWVLVVIAGAIIGYGSVYMTDVWLPDEGRARILYDLFGVPTFWLLALPMPIAITGAMIRHNLFDFTAVINRTLVYASLTAVLAGAYFGLSVLIGALIPVSENSPLVVAFSTLVVVTLFRPLRERIQRPIDQRFYRSKYDAARLVEKFGQRLRHEHDLGALTADLSGVVTEAMRPAHVSLWIPREDRRTDSSA